MDSERAGVFTLLAAVLIYLRPMHSDFVWLYSTLFRHHRNVMEFVCLFTSGFVTVQTLLLLLCALLPIFVLFSDLSKIFTSADQHSAQTTNFLEKEDSLPPTASSLHSGDR